jgi:signal transduction histidine kinase
MKLGTTARLTLANSALLAAGFGLMLVLVTWLAGRYMLGHVEESVQSELDILRAEYAVDGTRGVSGLIRQRLAMRSPDHDRIYRLEDGGGHMMAGNLDDWPPQAALPDHMLRLPSLRHPLDTDIVARWTALPDGSRLLVGFDEYEVEKVRADIRHAAFASFGLMLLVSLVGGWLLTRAVLRPVDTIRRVAQQIMTGDLKHRIPLDAADRHPDEFDRLALTLNAMLDRIEALIAGVRGATDNIAHDLRSPLTRHRSRIEAALRHPPPPEELPDWLERNLADIDQVLSTFQSLLRIARVDSGLLRGEFRELDLCLLARDALELMEPLAESNGLALHGHLPREAHCSGHRDLLFQTLLNLLDNAIKYSPVGGEVTLALHEDGDALKLVVRDQGPGIPEAERRRVFERLYRVEAARHTPGLGLGLSLVHSVVMLHGGRIELADAAPGLEVRVWLPRRPQHPLTSG